MFGCGDDGGGNGDGGAGNGDGGTAVDAPWVDFSDADPNAPDAGPNEGCTAMGPQCNNCIDDDSDGFIDGFDPHCTSSQDDDESSFATGIPGDNRDAINQDCFFDGNSGGGDDGCNVHVCCLLDLGGGDCPADLHPNQFDPEECAPTQECVDNCQPLTPPGCDCFGCCTVCNDDGCFDVLTNPAVAPDCDVDVLDDPELCPPCVQSDDCGLPCDTDNCILCPGQDEDDLPPECNMAECPADLTPCDTTDDCTTTEFCSQGCCISVVD